MVSLPTRIVQVAVSESLSESEVQTLDRQTCERYAKREQRELAISCSQCRSPMSQGPQLGDLGWKVDDGVEKLNKPSTDFQIHSFCDEIPVFNGTSIHDVLGDWCDVLSFNLSSEGIVILLANKSLTSSQAVTQQRTDLSAKR